MMRLKRHLSLILLAAFALVSLGGADLFAAGGGHGAAGDSNFPLPDSHYVELEAEKAKELDRELTLIETLKLRAAEDPFNVVATAIFFLAICHTFVAGSLMKLAHKFEHDHEHKLEKGVISHNGVEGKRPVSFKATLFHFLGEVEAVFGLWLIPLIIAIVAMKGSWGVATGYIDTRNFVEPMVVVVLMAIASSRPIVQAAERNVTLIAGLGGRSPGAYWFSILTIAPLLGSFITEPAAMTIAAILLGQQFYKHNPSSTHKYATLGLLFVNISVGGTLTHFAAPPVLMVAGTWGWDMPFMFFNYGWKAIVGILISNVIYFAIFRKSFSDLKKKVAESPKIEKTESNAPTWIVTVHAIFLAWTIIVLHHPALFIGGFLFFLAFTMATDHHQYQISLKGPMLVGFFLAGLVTHGGLQGWWISPVLSSLTELPLFIGSTVLTAFNDNAAITYLASQVPAFSEPEAAALRYAVVAGAGTGGGLTVIANAPNPAGQSLLNKYFDGGIAPIKLMAGALLPTVILALCFMIL
ncbi:putative Na+/H+ antiporter [Pelagicoccus mobilis]|uniref:Na+/H+ antiporter n=1 Tax=Pelagicoccus mobilis TaxID=415221 RepID=A0A934RX33_9BACT|nr:putative Na+/H+ antiporter [Pelagicoccus mobilis]MBK1878126.1 putative Na+/H+ antiporter [Pelagicoccus mobilis]